MYTLNDLNKKYIRGLTKNEQSSYSFGHPKKKKPLYYVQDERHVSYIATMCQTRPDKTGGTDKYVGSDN